MQTTNFTAPVSSRGITGKNAIASAFILGTVGAGGFTLLPVTLPALASAFGLSEGAVGLVSTLELVGVTGGALLAGFITRRLPTRPMALVATGILLACVIATMFVTSIAVLAGVRFIDGIAAGFTLGLAYAVLSTTKRPDRNFAFLAVLPLIYGTIGFAFIPSFEKSVGWHASFIVLTVTDTIGFLASFWLVATLAKDGVALSFKDTLPNIRGFLALASVVFYYAGLCAIYAFSFNIGMQMTGSDALTGSALSTSQFVGIGGCLLAAFIAGRVPRRAAIAFGFALTIGAIALFVPSSGTVAFFVGLLIVNFAWNFLAGSHIAAVGSMDERGSAAAFLAVAINGGAALGPLLGYTVHDSNYLTLEVSSAILIVVAFAFILVALKGEDGVANGRPVLEDEALRHI